MQVINMMQDINALVCVAAVQPGSRGAALVCCIGG